MSTLCRLSLLVACVAAVGSPTPTEAGIIPWMYDSVFGPVGSIRARSAYPSYAGYSTYYGSPYSVSYTPYAYGSGCSTCQTASYGACGCAPCMNGCASGNCSTGNCATGSCATGNCATGNCSATVYSTPGSTLSPIPDPANSTRGTRQPAPRNNGNRLDANEDDFNASPNRTYRNGAGSDPAAPNRLRGNGTNGGFESPIRANPRENSDMFEERSNPANPIEESPETSRRIPLPGDEESVIPSKKPAAAAPIEEKGPQPGNTETQAKPTTQTLKLDTRVTSRAISPRERHVIPDGFTKPLIASTMKPAVKLQVDAQPSVINVARH